MQKTVVLFAPAFSPAHYNDLCKKTIDSINEGGSQRYMYIYELEDYVIAHREQITSSNVNENSHFNTLFDMCVISIEKKWSTHNHCVELLSKFAANFVLNPVQLAKYISLVVHYIDNGDSMKYHFARSCNVVLESFAYYKKDMHIFKPYVDISNKAVKKKWATKEQCAKCLEIVQNYNIPL